MYPVRDLMQRFGVENYDKWNRGFLRPLGYSDIEKTLFYVKSSICSEEIERYIQWNQKFGTSRKH